MGNLKNRNKGYCGCGCGAKTNLATATHKRFGYKVGEPLMFLSGHCSRGKNNPRWKGGRRVRPDKYIYIWIPNNTTSQSNYVMEHILIVQRMLGKPIPPKAEIHHVDQNRGNNKNNNLVLCESVLYHRLLHTRTRAFDACGNASWRRCIICKEWDDLKNMSTNCQGASYHLPCMRKENKRRRIKKNAGL